MFGSVPTLCCPGTSMQRPFLHWPHSQLQLDVRPFDLDMYFDSFFFLAFYCDYVGKYGIFCEASVRNEHIPSS